MQRFTQTLIFFFLAILLIQCKDETYYERPKWLEPPIYQQLESRGNFTQYLASVDKTGFKRTLNSAGYFTVFAPNDEAFQRFFQENGYETLNDVDSTTLRSIVSYSLIYNRFEKARLADFQGSTGWVSLNAFKRRTAYYRGVHTENINNTDRLVMSSNRNGFNPAMTDGGYFLEDFNNKYIPYFLSDYLAEKGLSSYDYNFFYPHASFTGFNVGDGSVIAEDINAENGIIHEVDKVILPLQSIDEYIADKPQYSEFKRLLSTRDTLFLHPTITKYYQALSNSSDPVYVKYFANVLAFSPNNESFLRSGGSNDAQSNGWSIIVPTNDVLQNYINNVLLDKTLTNPYKSLETMPRTVIEDLLNAHMYQTTLWPSKFGTTSNVLGEAPTIDPSAHVVDGKVLSNGMFYGTNKVHEANVFHSVYGNAYLNRSYSLMTTFLQRELKSTLINQFSKYVVFLISNDALLADGYSQNPSTLEWVYDAPPVGGTIVSGGTVVDRLNRLMNLHIVRLNDGGDQLSNLSGEGIVQTLGGEYIKYKNGALYAAGNLEVVTPPSILTETAAPKAVASDTRTANNGKTYAINRILKYPELPLGRFIASQGDVATKPYYEFYQYLRQSTLWNNSTFEIAGVSLGSFHTVLIPTNAAIASARASGKLPPVNTTCPPNAPLPNACSKIADWLRYHFIVNSTIVPDGDPNTPGSQETILVNNSVRVQLGVINNKNDLRVLDYAHNQNPGTVQQAKVIMGSASNQLAQRAVIHQIDRVLDSGL